MSFRDHFSLRADEYARFRPVYPEALYAALSDLAPSRQVALDCATGSGQAALGLAAHFPCVLATDASALQLRRARPHPRVHYSLALAERPPLRDGCCDLISVAAGAHWLDLETFYPEVRRLSRPGGILALWSYYMFQSEAGIDTVLDHYAHAVLGAFWPERMHFNQNRYLDLPFPFERLAMPPFQAEVEWTLEHLFGFMSTWSASQRYAAARGTDPIDRVRDDLRHAWGNPQRRVRLRWPLHLLVGRVASRS